MGEQFMEKVIITGNIGVITPEVVLKYQNYINEELPDVSVEFLSDLPISEDELIERAKGATIIISVFQKMSDKVYKALKPELKAFVSHGIGTDVADVESATRNNILVTNVPDYCLEEVANHTVTMILSSYRKIPEMIDYVDRGEWGQGYKEIEDRKRFSEYTIGLYGFGSISKIVADMISGFGCRIISNDPYVSNEAMKKYGVESVSFEELIKESDIISLHAPLLPSTEGAFDLSVFKKMKSDAILVNTARGGLINVNDLYEALTKNIIGYAALDVFISEPPDGIEKKLIALKNTMITPHIAYYSKTAFDELLLKTSKSVISILKDELPKYVVNKEVVDKLNWLK